VRTRSKERERKRARATRRENVLARGRLRAYYGARETKRVGAKEKPVTELWECDYDFCGLSWVVRTFKS